MAWDGPPRTQCEFYIRPPADLWQLPSRPTRNLQSYCSRPPFAPSANLGGSLHQASQAKPLQTKGLRHWPSFAVVTFSEQVSFLPSFKTCVNAMSFPNLGCLWKDQAKLVRPLFPLRINIIWIAISARFSFSRYLEFHSAILWWPLHAATAQRAM